MSEHTVSLRLPQPPSVDCYWRPWRGRMVMTQAGRDYRKTVWALSRQQLGRAVVGGVVFPKPMELMVVVAWHRSRKSGDTDNRLKPLLDGLQGVVYTNDAQVGAILMWRDDTKDQPAQVEVVVEPWSLDRMPQLLLHLGAGRV